MTADLAVIGVGVVPASEIANNVAGLDVDARGFIPVDSSMSTSLPGVWAAGDVASFPLHGFSEDNVTIGHWGLAMYLGKTAALAMLALLIVLQCGSITSRYQANPAVNQLAVNFETVDFARRDNIKLLAFHQIIRARRNHDRWLSLLRLAVLDDCTAHLNIGRGKTRAEGE